MRRRHLLFRFDSLSNSHHLLRGAGRDWQCREEAVRHCLAARQWLNRQRARKLASKICSGSGGPSRAFSRTPIRSCCRAIANFETSASGSELVRYVARFQGHRDQTKPVELLLRPVVVEHSLRLDPKAICGTLKTWDAIRVLNLLQVKLSHGYGLSCP